MSRRVVAVAIDIKKIPYVNDTEVIFTPGKQRIWYTANTVSIEIPKVVQLGDVMINKFINKFLKKSKKQDILKLRYFTMRVAKLLKKSDYNEIIFENDELKNRISSKLTKEYVIRDAKGALSAEGQAPFFVVPPPIVSNAVCYVTGASQGAVSRLDFELRKDREFQNTSVE